MVVEKLSEFFKQYPYSSNVLISLVLIVLEKAVEYDFVCPCKEGFKAAFFWCYLLVPVFISFVFGLYLMGFEFGCCSWSCRKIMKFVACWVPGLVWFALFLCDGRYLACLKTVLKDGHAESNIRSQWEWCSKRRNLTEDQIEAEKAFFVSKLSGLGLLCLISILALGYKCFRSCFEGWTCLDFEDEKPCCSEYQKNCGSSHCKNCCEKHKRDCCDAHRRIKCLAHKESSSSSSPENIPLEPRGGNGTTDTVGKPCDKNTCPCRCHQTCDCECHKRGP